MSRVPWEVRAVLALVVLDGAAVVATYSRLPPAELYHVHHSGIAAGFGRELVSLNFPFALVGIALVGLAWPRLGGRLRLAGAAAVALCAVVVVAVHQSDLDARPINALPALGLAAAVALVLAAGVEPEPRRRRGDGLRLALAALLLLFAAPLIAAELGFYLDGVPVLGWLFETGRLTREPGIFGLHPAVHHGQHHGWEGAMLALSALALSRLPRPRLLDAYLALLLAYGVGNLVNDDWLEQVVKRGWTRSELPSVLLPAANWGWAAVLAGAACVWLCWFRQPGAAPGRRPRSPGSPRGAPGAA
ncbi:MAG TPA: hypothetical protein VE995_03035 [Gaiellaceae bacterium]|nr:hypothetical protein [Gaiellaceae bacterium]